MAYCVVLVIKIRLIFPTMETWPTPLSLCPEWQDLLFDVSCCHAYVVLGNQCIPHVDTCTTTWPSVGLFWIRLNSSHATTLNNIQCC